MNGFQLLLIIAPLSLSSVSVVTADDPGKTVKLLRLGIVDDSGSMLGERITTVRDEWLALARQLPPSVENPIVLVTFGSSASAPQLYVDLPSFETAIGQLNGESGGTNIAAGLREGIAYLESAGDAQDVWVFLYSDGEDPNQTGILEEEAKLDAVFSDRQQQGLPQTVFLKRWGNANADLLNRIQSRGRAKVLDAGELSVRPITFDPHVDLLGVSWNPDDPQKLDIEFAPRLDVHGAVDGLNLPTITLEVAVDDATGDRSINVQSGSSAVTRKVTVPVSAEARRSGQLNLPFVLTAPADITTDGAKVLPLLAANQIDLPIELPEDRYTYRVVVSAAPQTGTWNDTLARRFRTPLQLQFEVRCQEGDIASPGDIELVPTTGTVVISGPTSVTLPASGSVTVDLVVETSVINPADPLIQWQSRFEFAAKPIRTPPHVTFDPPELAVTGDLTIPPPVVTTIAAKVIRISKAEWLNLTQGTARFQVETEFDVQGQIAPQSQINLVTTGSVINVDTKPATLQKGIQRVTLDVTAVLPQGPKTQTIESQVVPPASDGVIQYQVGLPLHYTVTGPQALQLGVAFRGRPVGELRTSIADNDTEARVQFEPVVLGMKPSALVDDLDVRIAAQNDPLKFASLGPYRVFRRCQLAVPVSVSATRSFFHDTVLAASIDVEPFHGNTAVQGSTVPLVVVVAAPFKRLLWQLALTLSTILAAVVIARMYLTLRRSN